MSSWCYFNPCVLYWSRWNRWRRSFIWNLWRGGGGAYAYSLVTVTPGVSYSIIAGGNSDAIFRRTSDSLVYVFAVKGTEGHSEEGGPGGQASLCIGSIKYSGGNGANPLSENYSGAGGSAALNTNGINATTYEQVGITGYLPVGDNTFTINTYGASGLTSPSGRGLDSSTSIEYAGGGGGGGWSTSGSAFGGSGARALVVIKYQGS